MPSGLDLDKLRHRFLQFGGWSLLWQYAKMGVLWCGIKALIRCVVSGASVKTAYPSIIQGVEEILVKRYRPFLDKRLHEQAGQSAEQYRTACRVLCGALGCKV